MIETILLISITALLGTCLGVLTGLIPGLHVNNVAIILLSISPLAAEGLMDLFGLDQYTVLLMVSAAIVATSMAHTFLDFIPSTFLGAPEPETALSVLPAHGMLMEGNGFRAVFLSAVGSFGAVIVGCLLLIPYRLMVNEPVNGYAALKEYMVWVLIGVVILMLVTETSEVPYLKTEEDRGKKRWSKGRFSRTLGVILAMFLFLLSGILGLAALDLKVTSPFGLPATVLFPLLSGLFGTSTLIESLRGGAEVPDAEYRTRRGGIDRGRWFCNFRRDSGLRSWIPSGNEWWCCHDNCNVVQEGPLSFFGHLDTLSHQYCQFFLCSVSSIPYTQTEVRSCDSGERTDRCYRMGLSFTTY